MESGAKLLEYVNKVAKEPIIINGKPYGAPIPTQVTLNPSFFLKDGCHMCGKCCPHETTVWTESGYRKIIDAIPSQFTEWGLNPDASQEALDGIKQTTRNINGKEVSFYTFPADKVKEAMTVEWPDRKASPRCHWLFEKDGTYRCRIHPIRSVTCRMPHIRFFYNSKTAHTSIGVSQYGRNWALKCPVQLDEVDEHSVASKIENLIQLNVVCNDVGVETYLPQIIKYLQDGHRKPVVFMLKSNRLFGI